jgi:dTDP-4-amino-4,6-dideoxy-D-galactose acyltransferase
MMQMIENEIKYLHWDSVFFNKKIGRIDIENINELKFLLYNAKNCGYQLIYVFGCEVFYAEDEILKQFNGHLADRKVLFKKELQTLSETPAFVHEYKNEILTSELLQLAYQSGEYSRFKLDNNFREGDFYRMYKTWLEKSIKEQMADKIFIISEENLIKAMVTLKINAEKGHIDLIAVSPEAQRKGYGKALITACENELLSKNIFTLEVPTQFENKQACTFYKKCGFAIHSITNIYHFWF